MNIIVTSTNEIHGREILNYIGVVRGIVVRTPTIKQGIKGGFKAALGGTNPAFTKMCEETREEAYNLMCAHAVELGAHAIIGMRYDASHVDSQLSAIEILCYGTAVNLHS